jgi:hypothetical protein
LSKITFLFLLFFSTACGGSGGDSSNTTTTQPVLIAAVPNTAKAGDTVTLQGLGFSFTFNENIVLVGNETTQALSHQFINTTPGGANEEITFQVPPNAAVGGNTITVLIDGAVSNALPFTVASP